MSNIINIIGFQLGWWCCVIGASHDKAYLGPLVMTIFLVIHFQLNRLSITEILFIFIVGIIGTIIDSIFYFLNIIIYSASYSNLFAPIWITFMWIGFAATINHSMAWLNKRYKLAFILGLVFGPFSYITGEKFNVINFNYGYIQAVIILSLVWSIIIPTLYFINNKLDKIISK